MLVQGYHFPFPASGYIVEAGTGYDVVPVMWQPIARLSWSCANLAIRRHDQ